MNRSIIQDAISYYHSQSGYRKDLRRFIRFNGSRIFDGYYVCGPFTFVGLKFSENPEKDFEHQMFFRAFLCYDCSLRHYMELLSLKTEHSDDVAIYSRLTAKPALSFTMGGFMDMFRAMLATHALDLLTKEHYRVLKELIVGLDQFMASEILLLHNGQEILERVREDAALFVSKLECILS